MSFSDIYRHKKVLITGHTGFKGTWLAAWLQGLGAKVFGFALEPDTEPNHHRLLNLEVEEIIGDINNPRAIAQWVDRVRPDIVFHLAAQPLVRESYRDPAQTYATNVIGTLNLYEALRHIYPPKAIVSITTDKVYQNLEEGKAFVENDALGGHDPYSASKACMEILNQSYRKSFFEPMKLPLISLRAGNVIGGGDWAKDRLIPDIVRSVKNNVCLDIRYPKAIRPWQHVIEPLSAYMLVGQKLLEGKPLANAYNIGPSLNERFSVEDVLMKFKAKWEHLQFQFPFNVNELAEAGYLALNSSAIEKDLDWKPVLGFDQTIDWTIAWYDQFAKKNKAITHQQIQDYTMIAQHQGFEWAN
jgi:CDP-glucose 4,6-dehydratase